MPDNSLAAGHSQNKLHRAPPGGLLISGKLHYRGVKPYTKRKVKMENFSVGLVLTGVGWVSGLKGKNRGFTSTCWNQDKIRTMEKMFC
jgi:hypothetical protein